MEVNKTNKYINGSEMKVTVSMHWWHSGSARVSQHCDWGSIPTAGSNLIKFTLVTCEKSVVQLDSTKHRRFSPGTPVSFCHNTGTMSVGPY